MKKCLISLALILCCTINCTHLNAQIKVNKPIDKLMNSFVSVIIQKGQCSGVIVGESLVLTALHCFVSENGLYDYGLIKDNTNIYGASINKISGTNDLILLNVTTKFAKDRIAIVSKTSVNLLDEVLIVAGIGNTLILSKGIVNALTAPIQNGTGGSYVMLTAAVYYGMSGGGVYNSSGELIALVHAFMGQFTLITDLNAIQKILAN